MKNDENIWKRLEFGSSVDGLVGRKLFNNTVKSLIPLQREQTAEDIGNMVAFLVSDLAKNITGQAVNVDGGRFTN